MDSDNSDMSSLSDGDEEGYNIQSKSKRVQEPQTVTMMPEPFSQPDSLPQYLQYNPDTGIMVESNDPYRKKKKKKSRGA